MNIDSSATITKSTSATDSSQSASATQKTDEQKSFKEELEAVKPPEDKAAQQEVQQKAEEKTVQVSAEKSVTIQKQKEADLQKQKGLKAKEGLTDGQMADPLLNQLFQLKAEIANVKDVKISSTSKTKSSDNEDCDTKINYQIMKMDNNDALFFANLVKNGQVSVQGDSDGSADLKVASAEKTFNVSATLMDSLNESMKTNKPFRIDFDKDISVILRVGKDGKLSANFIPGDKAVETYLKNNISSLQQTFDEQNLPYSRLSYQQQKEKQSQENQQGDSNKKNKENDDE